MSCADSGNFLCKKFHKTSHTLHSLITRKFNEPHERSAKLSSENAGCLQDFSDDTESRLTRMWFKNYETMTVFVVCFTNELLFIPLSWQFDSVICCLIDSGSQSGVTVLVQLFHKIVATFVIPKRQKIKLLEGRLGFAKLRTSI